MISVSVSEPAFTDQGWRFGFIPERPRGEINGFIYLHGIYTKGDPAFTGRAAAPVLGDTQKKAIVSNESADIVRMLYSGFGTLGDSSVDLYPEDLRSEIDALNDRMYSSPNNGVYRGFATAQEIYEEAFWNVFGMLDRLEACSRARLSDSATA